MEGVDTCMKNDPKDEDEEALREKRLKERRRR